MFSFNKVQRDVPSKLTEYKTYLEKSHILNTSRIKAHYSLTDHTYLTYFMLDIRTDNELYTNNSHILNSIA